MFLYVGDPYYDKLDMVREGKGSERRYIEGKIYALIAVGK